MNKTISEILNTTLSEIILAFGIDDKSQIPLIKAKATQAITQAMLDVLPEKKQADYVKKTSPNTTTTDESKCRFYRYGGYDFAISEMETAIKKMGEKL